MQRGLRLPGVADAANLLQGRSDQLFLSLPRWLQAPRQTQRYMGPLAENRGGLWRAAEGPVLQLFLRGGRLGSRPDLAGHQVAGRRGGGRAARSGSRSGGRLVRGPRLQDQYDVLHDRPGNPWHGGKHRQGGKCPGCPPLRRSQGQGAVLWIPGIWLLCIYCTAQARLSPQVVFLSLLALLPSPIVYGAIIDKTCLLWQKVGLA